MMQNLFKLFIFKKEVISVAIGEKSTLVASGEKDEYPSIHIWDSNTLQNKGIIKGFHTKGVKLMTFFKNNEFLVTCGIK